MMINKNKQIKLTFFKGIIFLLFSFIFINKTYSQAGLDLPLIENFEKDEVWIWEPWKIRGDTVCLKTKGSAHTGNYGLYCQRGEYFIKMNQQIGMPGEAISWWVRFQNKTNAYCGFGIDSINELGYFLCVSPAGNSFGITRHPINSYYGLKPVTQKYKMNTWYRIELVFNTTTNITGNLYASNGTKLLNTINLEIPNLLRGGISFRGYQLHLDDIRGGTKQIQLMTDSIFDPIIGQSLVLANIQFDPNKSNLLEQSYMELDKLVSYLKKNTTYKITINGYTDNLGREEENKNLSKARAEIVADYLIKNNINKNRISSNGFGSLNPIATNSTTEGKKRNRRVECIIKSQ